MQNSSKSTSISQPESFYHRLNGSFTVESGYNRSNERGAPSSSTHPAFLDITQELLTNPYACSECGGSLNLHTWKKLEADEGRKFCPICKKEYHTLIFNWTLASKMKLPGIKDPAEQIHAFFERRGFLFDSSLTSAKNALEQQNYKARKQSFLALRQAYEVDPGRREEIQPVFESLFPSIPQLSTEPRAPIVPARENNSVDTEDEEESRSRTSQPNERELIDLTPGEKEEDKTSLISRKRKKGKEKVQDNQNNIESVEKSEKKTPAKKLRIEPQNSEPEKDAPKALPEELIDLNSLLDSLKADPQFQISGVSKDELIQTITIIIEGHEFDSDLTKNCKLPLQVVSNKYPERISMMQVTKIVEGFNNGFKYLTQGKK